MTVKAHFELLATYNQWMNNKVYEAALRLDNTELTKDRGAFFGSILGTLNHIYVGDIIWLKRFASHPTSPSFPDVIELPTPSHLDQILFEDIGDLAKQRAWLDNQIIHWVEQLSDQDLDSLLSYHNTKGIPANKHFGSLILHFFNHQTHHRGQVTTLLSQAGEEVGITDLLALIDQES
jgi:uncharacterized damage-inducible protein DinB